jgi:hypothetical protein
MKEIFERLKADFEYTTGYEYVGLVKSIGAGFAVVLYSTSLNFATVPAGITDPS